MSNKLFLILILSVSSILTRPCFAEQQAIEKHKSTTGRSPSTHVEATTEDKDSAILGYRIVGRSPRIVEIEVEYLNASNSRPWLSVSAKSPEMKYGITASQVQVEPGKGKKKFTLKRQSYQRPRTTHIHIKMWRTMLDVLAEREFEEHLAWHLEGKNEIHELRVASVTDNHAELEIDYFYNDASNETPHLRINAEMEGERNQTMEAQPAQADIAPGNNTVNAKIYRQFPSTEWSRANRFFVEMYDYEGNKLAERSFDVQAEWDAIDYLLSDGNNKRADTETLYKRAANFITMGGDYGLKSGKHIIDQILLDSPEFVPAYNELARYYMKTNWNKQGRSQAERVLLSALELEPKQVDTLVLLGYVYTHQQRYEEATATLTKAEKIGTNNPWLHANWGELLHKQGKINEAINRYLLVTNKPRTHDRNDRAKLEAYIELKKLYLTKNDLHNADKILEGKASDYSENPCFYGQHAEFKLAKLGDADAAIEKGNLALNKGCKWPDPVRRTVGAAHMKKWADAIDKNNGKASKEIIALYNKGLVLFNDPPAMYFYFAKRGKVSSVIPNLKNKGLDIDAVNAQGLSALAMAIQAKNLKAVERLLENGADANKAIGEDLWSPLLMATFFRDKNIIDRLIKAGANTETTSKSGLSPLDLAQELGEPDIVKLLSLSGA